MRLRAIMALAVLAAAGAVTAVFLVDDEGTASGLPPELTNSDLQCLPNAQGEFGIERGHFDAPAMPASPDSSDGETSQTNPEDANARSPEGAVAQYIELEGTPGLVVDDFELRGQEEGVADFNVVRDGRVVHVVRVRAHEDGGWVPDSYVSCSG